MFFFFSPAMLSFSGTSCGYYVNLHLVKWLFWVSSVGRLRTDLTAWALGRWVSLCTLMGCIEHLWLDIMGDRNDSEHRTCMSEEKIKRQIEKKEKNIMIPKWVMAAIHTQEQKKVKKKSLLCCLCRVVHQTSNFIHLLKFTLLLLLFQCSLT